MLSDVKLALLEVLPPDAPVTVLQRLGLADEYVHDVALVDLDRVVEPDHLTTLYVDTGARPVAGEFARLVAAHGAAARPGRVPVGRRADAPLALALHPRGGVRGRRGDRGAARRTRPSGGVDAAPDAYAALGDELGDLLCQVVFHSVLAREAGAFTVADVVTGIHDKLVRRHPHVFGDAGSPMAGATTSDDVMHNWEQIKKQEKATDSLVEGITPGPAVAALRPQAVPQGRVGRPRPGHPRRGGRPDRRRRRPAPGRRRPRGGARRPARRRRRRGPGPGGRRRIGAPGLGGPLPGALRAGRGASPPSGAPDLGALDPAGVAALWLEAGDRRPDRPLRSSARSPQWRRTGTGTG